MAITEERLEGVVELTASDSTPQVRPEPHLEGAAQSPRLYPRTISASVARRLSVAWILLFGSVLVLEPAPANPDAPLGFWAGLLFLGFTAALTITMIGLGRRRHWGLVASAWAGGLGVIIAAACAVTDHHPGLWWGYEMVVFAGLTAFSALAPRFLRSS